MTEPFTSYLTRLLISLVIGGAIGLEREFKGKPAGMRTNMLLCLGSCLIMIISIEVAQYAPRVADPGRIAAQVITGIGFLGAGTILRSRFHVVGLTTAATMWALTALGLAIGAGYILLAVVVAALITITLILIGFIEKVLETKRAYHVIQVAFDPREGTLNTVLGAFTALKISSEELEMSRSGETWRATFEYATSREKHQRLVEKLSAVDGVKGIMES
jgi:putative Mg2+ transporter-C (MgtC) family protein